MGSDLHHEWVIPATDAVSGGLPQVVALDDVFVTVPDVDPFSVKSDATLIVGPVLHRAFVAVVVEERCHEIPRHQ